MKRVMATVAIIAILNTNAQITAAGLQIKGQTSSQIYHNPQTPQHGISGTRYLNSIGGDLFVNYTLSKRFKIRLKGGYEEKGATQENNFYFPDASIGKLKEITKFNYISTDITINYNLTKKEISPYIFTGISTGYLLNILYIPNTGNNHWDQIKTTDFTETYKTYSDFNLGGVIGAGLDFNNKFWIEFEFNPDLILSLKTSDFVAKHNSSSINLGINILKLFKK
jgi:hypothetical protein